MGVELVLARGRYIVTAAACRERLACPYVGWRWRILPPRCPSSASSSSAAVFRRWCLSLIAANFSAVEAATIIPFTSFPFRSSKALAHSSACPFQATVYLSGMYTLRSGFKPDLSHCLWVGWGEWSPFNWKNDWWFRRQWLSHQY